jgi:UDP-N-acetyl-D-mannosaminuronic acid dehydrogenase
MKNNKKKNVCVIGLGFVGLTLAVSMASKGFIIYGIEKNKKIIQKIKKGKPHFFEPNLEKKLTKLIKKKKIFFSNKLNSKINCDTYIITVGTPIDKNKKIITKYIRYTSEEVSKYLKNDDLIILRSTVKVGTTRKIVKPILEKSKKFFSLSFCPERTLEGAALKELNYLPQIIGGVDGKSISKSKEIFSKITRTTISVSSLEVSEMIKLVDNSNRDVKFAYANEVARICDSLKINAQEVIKSGKYKYPRTNLPSPGLVGGPCLEKDPYIFSNSINNPKLKAELTLFSRLINERQPFESVKYLKNKFFKNRKNKIIKICVIGLAFKGFPVTNDVRGSMSYKVIEAIKNNFSTSHIFGYDPLVSGDDFKSFRVKKCDRIIDAFKNKDLVIFANNHPSFKKIDFYKISKNLNKNSIVYDFWNNLKNKDKNNLKSKYIQLGNHI